MEEERIDHAIQRIEAALARINAASDKVCASAPSVSDPRTSELAEKHDALRAEVAATLSELDQLIDGIDV